jgi:hypothetical protein
MKQNNYVRLNEPKKKGFVVKALTYVGNDALEECIKEEKEELSKKKLIDVFKFKKVWIHTTTRNPLVDSWMINPNAIRLITIDIDLCVLKVKNAMEQIGAVKGLDYEIEVFK